MRHVALALILLAATACGPTNTVGEAAPSRTVWTLEALNDAPASFPATLRLLADGSVTGTGPCSSFTARQTAPLPWVKFKEIDSTGRTCPDARNEAAFFITLDAMEFAEVAGDNLLLTNERGQSLFFRSAQRAAGQL